MPTNGARSIATLFLCALAPLAGCGAGPTRAADSPRGEEGDASGDASMQGLSLRLVVLPDAHLPTLRLYLVNEGGEPRRYLLSDKLNPTRVVIRDDSGSSIDPADDGRDIPDFDSGAKAPVIETLAGHAEVPIDEEAFTFHRKGSPSDYALFWRPFGYSPFKPGTYRIRAVWRSSHGFVGELVSNEVTLVLPVPEP